MELKCVDPINNKGCIGMFLKPECFGTSETLTGVFPLRHRALLDSITGGKQNASHRRDQHQHNMFNTRCCILFMSLTASQPNNSCTGVDQIKCNTDLYTCSLSIEIYIHVVV